MIQSSLDPIDTLAAELSRLYAALEATGRRTIEALRTSDPILVEELVATFESEDVAAGWVASRTLGFGRRSALELLAQGEREQVLHVLHHLRYGFCA